MVGARDWGYRGDGELVFNGDRVSSGDGWW